MVGVDSVAIEFQRFAAWLTEERPHEIERIERLANGFEGWIKLEFFFWLTSHRSPPLTCAASSGAEEVDVGLEYALLLDQRFKDNRTTKQCDIWVRSSAGPSLFHYVELKAPFLNGNAGKILDSAGNDFWYMSRIRRSYEQAASGNAVVLGVGFDAASWARALDRLRAQAGVPDDLNFAGQGTLGRAERISWCVLTKTYVPTDPE
ncbi:MAG: hypothetical protein QM820_58135 [Minicystis sp.]